MTARVTCLLPALAAVFVVFPAASCKVKEGRAPSAIPAGISISLTVDGADAGIVDTAWLSTHAPDFRDADERRAWKLSSIAGPEAEAPGTVVEVQSGAGAGTELHAATTAIPAVTFNRNGELVVKLLDPANPFPPFHGRGGNRGRGGDQDRVRAVTAVRIRTAAESQPAAP